MDVPYRIPGGVVSGSPAFACPPLLRDSKSLLSESDSFATSARGSCGVDPGPVPLRIVGSFSASSMADLIAKLYKK